MKIRSRLDLIIRLEILVFALASLLHGGVFVDGYEHHEAHLAEMVIAAVLLVGLLIAGFRPRLATRVILVVQAFALLGTLVGIFTITIGVGPRTVPDIVFHLVMVPLLIWGLVLAWRWRMSVPGNDPGTEERR